MKIEIAESIVIAIVIAIPVVIFIAGMVKDICKRRAEALERAITDCDSRCYSCSIYEFRENREEGCL